MAGPLFKLIQLTGLFSNWELGLLCVGFAAMRWLLRCRTKSGTTNIGLGLRFGCVGFTAVRWVLRCRTESGTTWGLVGLIRDIRQNNQGNITCSPNPTPSHIPVVLNLFQHLRPQSMDRFMAGLWGAWVHARALGPEMPE